MASFYQKVYGSTLFMPLYCKYLMQNQRKDNECHSHTEPQHALDDAAALQKIFEEGGGVMDPHEMMELMM